MSVADRVHQALRESGANLARAGISDSTDLDALTLRDHTPLLARIAVETGVTVDWLLTGREPMRPVYLPPSVPGETVPMY